MRKFKIIEEGRMSISDRSPVKGGFSCYKDTYKVYDCPGAGKYAYCPIEYYSCNTNSVVICGGTGKYYNVPGGEGLTSNNDYIIIN